MSVKKEKLNGKMIEVSVKSTSIKSAAYDTIYQKMMVTFNNGTTYAYREVPVQLFTKFRLAKSQGQYFNKYISRNFQYKKVK